MEVGKKKIGERNETFYYAWAWLINFWDSVIVYIAVHIYLLFDSGMSLNMLFSSNRSVRFENFSTGQNYQEECSNLSPTIAGQKKKMQDLDSLR